MRRGSLSSFPHIQYIPQCIAENIEGIYEEHDGDAGDDGEEGAVGEEEVVVFFDHEAQGGVRGLYAKAEEGESGLYEYGGGEVAGGDDHEWPGDVGQYVAEDDAHVAQAQAAGGGDVLHLAKHEHLSADEAGGAYPHAEANGDEYLPEALAYGEGNGKHQQQGGDGIEYVDDPHNKLIYQAAEVAGYGAEYDAYSEGEQHGHHTHCQGNAGADEQAGEYVAAIAVGAQPEGAGGDEVFLYICLLRGQGIGKVSGRKEGGERIGEGVLQAIVYVVLGDQVPVCEVIIVDR